MFLIQEFPNYFVLRMQLSNRVANRPPRLSKKNKIILSPANQLNISQLLKVADNGPVRGGKFFLCRTLILPIKMTSVMTIVDDPEGIHALRLALYNCTENTIPVGTILAIKNPWLKPCLDGGLIVRVENKNDIIELDTKVS